MNPPPLRRLCVFLGARNGKRSLFEEQARALGALLAEEGIELVYGGGNTGLMGAVADGCLEREGSVIGVIPKALVGLEIEGKPVEHRGISRLEIVDSMHQRKARMAELADGFIALPGGYGTLEELFEVITWAQLGFHAKAIGILNCDGFFDPLLQFLDHLLAEGFISPQNRSLLIVSQCPIKLLMMMAERTQTKEPPPSWLTDPREL